MTICIIAINAFQGYWLWKTYQINRQQFASTVQSALFQSLEDQQVGDAKRLFIRKQKADSSSRMVIHRFDSMGSRHVRVFVNNRSDSISRIRIESEQPKRIVVTYDTQKRTTGANPLPADSIAKRISSLVLLDWTDRKRVNLAKLKAAYRSELIRRDIDATFQLDTLTSKPQNSLGNFVFYRNGDQLTTDDIIQTSPVPINPIQNLFVQATFAAPELYLLRQMGWLLGGSLLLLILTTGCFLFMLSTIMRQKKLSEVKSDFINNMTHELKTPIATVTAAVEALQNFGALNDPQRTQTYLAISQTNLQRLSDLVEKVLNLAVEEKRELVLHPEPVHLADVTNELITNHRLKATKPVIFDTSISQDAIVVVDRVHFGNALNNLIDNAIKYSRDKVTIQLSFRGNIDNWQLTVSDNGLGVPKAYQSAIFDRFFRVPTGNLHPVKGFGLGLAYVRQVVERHGGTITVQSEPGKGSEFTVHLIRRD
ncbi:hypothetical protein GCM10028806_17160 [Spirosoma terrae]